MITLTKQYKTEKNKAIQLMNKALVSDYINQLQKLQELKLQMATINN